MYFYNDNPIFSNNDFSAENQKYYSRSTTGTFKRRKTAPPPGWWRGRFLPAFDIVSCEPNVIISIFFLLLLSRMCALYIIILYARFPDHHIAFSYYILCFLYYNIIYSERSPPTHTHPSPARVTPVLLHPSRRAPPRQDNRTERRLCRAPRRPLRTHDAPCRAALRRRAVVVVAAVGRWRRRRDLYTDANENHPIHIILYSSNNGIRYKFARFPASQCTRKYFISPTRAPVEWLACCARARFFFRLF